MEVIVQLDEALIHTIYMNAFTYEKLLHCINLVLETQIPTYTHSIHVYVHKFMNVFSCLNQFVIMLWCIGLLSLVNLRCHLLFCGLHLVMYYHMCHVKYLCVPVLFCTVFLYRKEFILAFFFSMTVKMGAFSNH